MDELTVSRRPLFVLALSVPGLVACTLSGTGTGELTKVGAAPVPVTLEWRTDGDNRGTMSASLSNGEVYEGPFLLITHEIRDSQLAPMWNGWESGWTPWPYGPYANGTSDESDFATVYTGHVVATLKSAGARRLRCRFTLAEPASGMAGGGQGECQARDGTVLSATFPSH